MGGLAMGGGISTLKMGGVTIEVVTMGGVAMGGMTMGGGISTLTMGGVTIGGVSMEGVSMGGGDDMGFKAAILKRVIVVGLMSGAVAGVLFPTGVGVSDVGGVWGGLGGA